MNQAKAKSQVSRQAIHKAAKGSSALEGIDFQRALIDRKTIDILKKNGRAFSV